MRSQRRVLICLAIAVVFYAAAVWIGCANGATWRERISLSVLLSFYATLLASIPFGIAFGSQDKFWM